MRSEENKRTRILNSALKLFMGFGYSRVSTEEIARGAGVGKGTIYKLYESKQALMLAAIDYFAGQMEEVIAGILSDTGTTHIQKLQLLLSTMSRKLSQVNADVLRQAEYDYPEAYERILQARERIILNNIMALLRDGKQQGIYRPDMDEKLTANIVIGAVNHMAQAQVLATLNCSPEQLFQAILTTLLKGCLTDEYRSTIQ